MFFINDINMATEVNYIKDNNAEQLAHEKDMIVDLRDKVKLACGISRSIKLPKYIYFNIKDDLTLSISIKP